MKRYLVLENGEVFAGLALGAPCDTFGELVFTTGMNGYIETLTDPSYCGQIVLQTFPLIGNYGIIPADFEGKCCVRGYVVREACSTPSNFRCAQTLDAFLKENNIPGITGIDTRAVTRILREAGTMNAAICDAVAWAFPMIAVFSVVVELSIPKNSARMSASATASLSRLASSESHFVAFVFVWKLCSPARPGRRTSSPPGMTASCSPTAPATRRTMSTRSRRSPSSSAASRCSASASATSSWRWRRAAAP